MKTYKFMVINRTKATDQTYFDVDIDSMFLTEEMMVEIAQNEVPHFTNETHFLIVAREGREEFNNTIIQA